MSVCMYVCMYVYLWLHAKETIVLDFCAKLQELRSLASEVRGAQAAGDVPQGFGVLGSGPGNRDSFCLVIVWTLAFINNTTLILGLTGCTGERSFVPNIRGHQLQVFDKGLF